MGPNPDNQKALSVVFGGGWEFNLNERLGMQLFAMQHVGAVGDLQTINGPVADVTANFWSLSCDRHPMTTHGHLVASKSGALGLAAYGAIVQWVVAARVSRTGVRRSGRSSSRRNLAPDDPAGAIVAAARI